MTPRDRDEDGDPEHPNLRPRDAATLIVLRRDRSGFRLLMGRRSDRHVFMPGRVVFPGGRVDAGDRSAPALDALDPIVEAKLLDRMRNRPSPARARALALAAIRETYEETGILVGRRQAPERLPPNPAWRAFLAHGVTPSLAPLRLVARAITPPRRSRRFDARFFAAFAEDIAGEVPVPDSELQDPAWLSFEEARRHPLPRITRLILDGLDRRLAEDPELTPAAPVPFHHTRHGRFRTDFL